MSMEATRLKPGSPLWFLTPLSPWPCPRPCFSSQGRLPGPDRAAVRRCLPWSCAPVSQSATDTTSGFRLNRSSWTAPPAVSSLSLHMRSAKAGRYKRRSGTSGAGASSGARSMLARCVCIVPLIGLLLITGWAVSLVTTFRTEGSKNRVDSGGGGRASTKILLEKDLGTEGLKSERSIASSDRTPEENPMRFDLVTEGASPSPKPYQNIFHFQIVLITGETFPLSMYAGSVLLIVNVASQCGYTDINYRELQNLHSDYYTKGLRILAFPCNQFGEQEPQPEPEILAFAKGRGAAFQLTHKVDVNGPHEDPVWSWLKEHNTGNDASDVRWNFEKFLVARDGLRAQRFLTQTNPLKLRHLIEELLNEENPFGIQ